MNWAFPWAFGLILLILIIGLRAMRTKPAAVLFSSIENFKNIGGSWRLALRQLLIPCLSIATLTFLILAAARPQTISTIQQPKNARNIMLALDLSGSMRTRDFYINRQAINRLEAVKLVVSEFIQQRTQDRIGIVVFGTQAFLQCPLTSDQNLLLEMLKQLNLGLAGDGTAIGDGLGLALRRLEAVDGETKAIILLTDGVNTSGTVDPLQAAKVARDLKIKVHTVGIGSSGTARSASSSMFGPQHTKQYEFDEKTLNEIARITGGVYFNAENIQELQNVYAEIDKLEKSELNLPDISVPTEHFNWYVFWAAICYLSYLIINNFLLRRIPW